MWSARVCALLCFRWSRPSAAMTSTWSATKRSRRRHARDSLTARLPATAVTLGPTGWLKWTNMGTRT